MENQIWETLKRISKDKKKIIFERLRIENKKKENEISENKNENVVYTGARMFLQKVLVFADPVTLYFSARLV